MADRIVLLSLNGIGAGSLPDADEYGDGGAHTLAHAAEAVGGLRVPNLETLGLGYLGTIAGVRRTGQPDGCFGRMAAAAWGKDSTTGYWEMMGIALEKPFPTYPKGLPADVIESLQRAIGRNVIGNYSASAAAILPELGVQHLNTGSPIVFTGTGSVVQVAAHERMLTREELYGLCRTARRLLAFPHHVARVIARPFAGEAGAFLYTAGRRDFSTEPPGPSLLDFLKAAGHPVIGIGRIDDLFKGRGLTRALPAQSDAAALDETLRALKSVPRGLILAHLIAGAPRAEFRPAARVIMEDLQAFDARLPELIGGMQPNDLLCITADHGNDPARPDTDHTREYVPVLVYGSRVARGVNLGTRKSLADLGQTIAEALGIKRLAWGESFLPAIVQG